MCSDVVQETVPGVLADSTLAKVVEIVLSDVHLKPLQIQGNAIDRR